MGRRSRKCRTGPVAPAAARSGAGSPHVAPRTHRARMAGAPRAPWSPFPLVELRVLIALVLSALGVVTDGPRRAAFLACGIALASLELAIREHVAGFRSHSALLAGAAAVVVVVYSLAFGAPRRVFSLRTGAIGFRV